MCANLEKMQLPQFSNPFVKSFFLFARPCPDLSQVMQALKNSPPPIHPPTTPETHTKKADDNRKVKLHFLNNASVKNIFQKIKEMGPDLSQVMQALKDSLVYPFHPQPGTKTKTHIKQAEILVGKRRIGRKYETIET